MAQGARRDASASTLVRMALVDDGDRVSGLPGALHNNQVTNILVSKANHALVRMCLNKLIHWHLAHFVAACVKVSG